MLFVCCLQCLLLHALLRDLCTVCLICLHGLLLHALLRDLFTVCLIRLHGLVPALLRDLCTACIICYCVVCLFARFAVTRAVKRSVYCLHNLLLRKLLLHLCTVCCYVFAICRYAICTFCRFCHWLYALLNCLLLNP